ncbi:hypothetical protein HDU76_012793 [Blyttiomyces sp. JEL0837]|nr:hypothetical protein HDU76_012793 [Blyttiomyces sp. JEL0837]
MLNVVAPTQTMSNPKPLRIRKLRDMETTPDGKLASTFQSSYLPHDVKSSRERERGEYVKNKGKAGKGGEWWGHVESRFETSSCYRDSFKEHNYSTLRQREKGRELTKDEEQNFRNQWFQYRMKKPPTDDPGKHYDILTGQELSRIPSGVHQPGRRVGRVSIDKLNAEKYGLERGNDKRTYNIISNAPLLVIPGPSY